MTVVAVKLKLFCRCGASWTSTVTAYPGTAAKLAAAWKERHRGEGCKVYVPRGGVK